METFWTLAIASVSGLWVMVTYIRDSRSRLIERSSAAMSRLLQLEDLSTETALIQQYLSNTAGKPFEFFRADERLGDPMFFQAKAMIYLRLNIMDEILSAAKPVGFLPRFLRPSGIIEFDNWKEYFLIILSHPFARSIMGHPKESKIFGDELQKFYADHLNEIPAPSDPFIW